MMMEGGQRPSLRARVAGREWVVRHAADPQHLPIVDFDVDAAQGDAEPAEAATGLGHGATTRNVTSPRDQPTSWDSTVAMTFLASSRRSSSSFEAIGWGTWTL